MSQQYPKQRRKTLLILIFSLLVGLGLSTSSLAQEPSRDSLNDLQANEAIRPLTNFSQQAKLTVDEDDHDTFSGKIAINDNTVAAGAQQGKVYIYEKPADGNWANATRGPKLTPVDNTAGDFVDAIAMNKETVVVGVADKHEATGAAYVYTKPANGWIDMTSTAKLTASDGEELDVLGESIAISNDTIVVGAWGADGDIGAVYVYEKPAGGWVDMTETAKLTASDGQSGDFVGWSVAIDGDTVVIGSPDKVDMIGVAYVFTKPASGWTNMTETAKLTLSERQTSAAFGMTVGVNGEAAFISAPGADNGMGAVYVFNKPTSGWASATQTAKLNLTDRNETDAFGVNMAINGETLLFGVGAKDNQTGAAYIYTKPASGWTNMTETAKLVAADRETGDRFGASVGLSDDTIVIQNSMNFESESLRLGALYIFE